MNGPKYIWLQIMDEDGEPIPPDQWDLEATWAQSDITGYDPKYVREDIHEAELDRLRKLHEHVEIVRDAMKDMHGPTDDRSWRIWAGGYIGSMIEGLDRALQEAERRNNPLTRSADMNFSRAECDG